MTPDLPTHGRDHGGDRVRRPVTGTTSPSEAGLRQEREAEYQVYEVRGTPEEIGRRIAERRPSYWGPPLETLSREQMVFAHTCAELAGREHPPLLEEALATVEAFGRPPEEALVWFSVDLTERPGHPRTPAPPQDSPPSACPSPPSSCSTLAVLTPDGPLVGRNYDFFYWATIRHVVTALPRRPGLLEHVGSFDGVLGGRYDGLNEAGLWVSLHAVRSPTPSRRRPGLFGAHVTRVLLETCRTAAEAADRLEALPHLSSYAYLLADAREAVVVEAHPDAVRRRGADGRPVLVATNHFGHPDTAELARRPSAWSRRRLETLAARGRGVLEAWTRGGPAAAEEALTVLLRDHRAPVCGHKDGSATLWSALAHPASGRVRYCLEARAGTSTGCCRRYRRSAGPGEPVLRSPASSPLQQSRVPGDQGAPSGLGDGGVERVGSPQKPLCPQPGRQGEELLVDG